MSRASKLGFSLGSPLGATGAAGATGVTVQALGAGAASCWGQAAAGVSIVAVGRVSCSAGGIADRATYASAVGRVGILGLDPVTNVRKIGGTGLAAASGQIRAAGFRSAATGGSSTWGMAVAVCSFNARAIGRALGSGAATRCAIFAFATGRTAPGGAGLIGLNASATPGAGDTLSPSVGGISNKAF